MTGKNAILKLKEEILNLESSEWISCLVEDGNCTNLWTILGGEVAIDCFFPRTRHLFVHHKDWIRHVYDVDRIDVFLLYSEQALPGWTQSNIDGPIKYYKNLLL